MSRTLRRPMFRKGGNVGTGIMSGVVDRTQAADGYLPGSTAAMKGAMGHTAEGIDLANPFPQIREHKPMVHENINIEEMVGTPKTSADYIEELKAGAGAYGGMDPLTSFLLTAGPSVAGATGFADAVSKLQPATQQLIKQADAKAKYNRDLRLAGVKLGISAEDRAEQKTFDLKKLDLSQENQVKFLNDERAYQQLKAQDKRDYDEVIADRTRAFAKLDEEERKAFEEKLIREGRAFELEKIMKKFEQQKELIKIKTKADNQYTGKDFMEDYENSTHANNRARYENEVREEMNQTFGHENNGGVVLSEEGTGNSWQKDKSKKKNIGKVFFNLNDGKYYKFGYDLDSDGNKVTGWTTIDNLKDYEKPATIKGDGAKKNLLKQTVLTREDAQKEAKGRGYILIGEAPNPRRSQQWIAEQKKLLGDKAKTLYEIQSIIRMEKWKKEQEGKNKRGGSTKGIQ